MDKDRRKVSVVIPNYNRKSELERLLPSIANQTFDDYEVIIIDDFSPDRSAVEYIKYFIQDHRNMRLVENTENIGFVKTCNKGIRLSGGEYICILTNDTEVARNFIQRNVSIMDADRTLGVLSCIILDREGNNWFSGGSLNGWSPVSLRDDFQGIRFVDYVAGTACFYRREIFGSVGLLNEQFVMYHEDIEFCLRVAGQTNYRTCVFGEKLVRHYEGTSGFVTKEISYYGHRNLILLLKKYSPKSIPIVLFRYLRELANLLLVSVLQLDPKYLLQIPHIIRGIFAGLTTKMK
jgi:GT2 family glycosyltransferase